VKRVISFLAFLLLLPLPLRADSDSLDVWGGFGRKDNVYSCVGTDEKIIALTFDDGPHPKYTDEILDILSEYNVKATFFVIGKNAESYPKKLKRIAEEGHEIGNHTYSHITAGKSSEAGFHAELERTHGIIKRITGKDTVLFRPPTGYCNTTAVKSAADMNYKIIVWTVDTKDWMHTGKDSIVKNVKAYATGGCIILFHDFISSPSPTPAALSELIPYLLSEGYRFVTVSELLSYDGE